MSEREIGTEVKKSHGYEASKVTDKLKSEELTKKLLEMGKRRAEDMWDRTKGLLLKYVKPGQVVLDIGTGLGQTTSLFAEKLGLRNEDHTYKSVFSIDLGTVHEDEGVLSLDYMLKEPALKRGHSIAKGEDLPFGENTFDTVMVIDMLHHTPDPKEVLENAKRVLKKGGSIVVLENLLRSDLGPVRTWWNTKLLHLIDNTSNAQDNSSNPHSNNTFEDWRKIGEELGLELEEHVDWQWGLVDFIPGATNLGDREKPNWLRPFTDTMMVFKVKEISGENV